MSAAEHRIGRIVFDVPAPDQAAADRFAAMVRARFDAVVAPALEAALDRIDRPGETIRLGRLEIDLGTLGAAAVDADELGRRIVEGLAAALAEALPASASGTARVGDEAAELAHFLETGTLPWGEPGKALAMLAATLAALNEPEMHRLAARLRTVLIRRRAAERLVRQMPAGLVRRLLRALLPGDLSQALAGVFGVDAPAPSEPASPAPTNMIARLTDMIQRAASGRPPARSRRGRRAVRGARRPVSANAGHERQPHLLPCGMRRPRQRRSVTRKARVAAAIASRTACGRCPAPSLPQPVVRPRRPARRTRALSR